MSTILFLTACVNPNGMAYTKLNNPEVRLRQYKEALDWYLDHTDMKILLVENSGCDFSAYYQRQIDEGRLEFLCFEGNNYDRSRGKGYGEASIMEYGIAHSRLLKACPPEIQIVKITGRLVCKNINVLCSRYRRTNTVYGQLSMDDWNGSIAVSQVVMGPLAFFSRCFLPRREEINDSLYRHFEHVLYDAIRDWRRAGNRFREFWIPPVMEGVSGTSGAVIDSNISCSQMAKYRLMYILHRMGYRGYLNPFYHGKPKTYDSH